MKLAAIALASAFTLSSTYALAATQHHKSGVKTHHGSYARSNYGPNYNYGGGPNNRAGLKAVRRTKSLALMRPFDTPSLNSSGNRAASPGIPLGTTGNGPSPRSRLPRSPANEYPQ